MPGQNMRDAVAQRYIDEIKVEFDNDAPELPSEEILRKLFLSRRLIPVPIPRHSRTSTSMGIVRFVPSGSVLYPDLPGWFRRGDRTPMTKAFIRTFQPIDPAQMVTSIGAAVLMACRAFVRKRP